MNIDKIIVEKYLRQEAGLENHWIFSQIVPGEKAFEQPDCSKRDEVELLLKQITRLVKDFRPFNSDLYNVLFPQWRTITENTTVILSVGSPAPYDAMVRMKDGKEYVIFDLIRFLEYSNSGYDIERIIRQLLTHELAHICIHEDYPPIQYQGYIERLKYTTFDEGVAHILAFAEDMMSFDFKELVRAHFEVSIRELAKALSATDENEQKDYLVSCNAGSYWDKFAAISGKLFLAQNKTRIVELYRAGVRPFFDELLP